MKENNYLQQNSLTNWRNWDFLFRRVNLILFFAFLTNAQFLFSQDYVTIGSQTTEVAATTTNPVSGYYNSRRIQVIYTAAEIVAANGVTGNIERLAWDVSADYGGGSLPNYTIYMGHTIESAFTGSFVEGLEVVKTGFSYDPAVGFNDIMFDTPFDWDGSSNIIVEICFNEAPYVTPYGRSWAYAGVANSYIHRQVDGNDACGAATVTGQLADKPRVRFFMQIASCLAPSNLAATVLSLTEVAISWTPPSQIPSEGYEYVLSSEIAVPATNGTATTETSLSVADLSVGTYYLYVRSVCGDENFSSWAGPVAVNIIEGDVCATAVDLSTLTSPFSGTTVGASANYSIDCAGGNASPELFYYIEVPADYTLVIGQTVNGYDSENYLGYGDCPGSGGSTTQIACYDDSDTQTNTWVNTTGETQTVYWVQDGYNVITQTGTFTLAWSLTAPPPCTEPINLTATPTSASTATIGWTPDGEAPAGGYQYVFSSSNTTPTEDGSATTEVSVDITDLTFGTYYLFVRSDCGNGDFTEWMGPVAMSIIEGDLCETAIDLSTLTSPYDGTTVGASANYSIDCAIGNESPELFYYIEVPANYTLVIGQTANAYDSENYMAYGDCPGSGGSNTQIACYDDDDIQNTTWVNTTGSTQTVYWVQDGYFQPTQTGTFTLAWTLTAPPLCPEPEDLSATITSASTADLSWTYVGDAPDGGFEYVFSTDAAAPAGAGTQTDETSASVSDLTFTTYYLYVRSICGGIPSDWFGPAVVNNIEGDICATAIDLSTLTSPFDGTTVGATSNYSIDCAFGNTSPELFYYVEVPANYTLVIGQTVNGYDSESYLGYGDCPGSGGTNVQLACYDDPDVQNTTWANTTGETQTVYWIQDGYFQPTQEGTFTLAWTLTAPPACPLPEGLTATVTSLTTADLAWTFVGNEPNGGFEYVFSTDPAAPVGPGTQTNETLVTVSDLTFATYYLYVRSICDEEATEWVGPVSMSIVEGDICATAIDLSTLTSPFSGTTVGSSSNYSIDCAGGNTSPELFYFIEVPANYTLVIGQTANNYDSENYVSFGDCPGSGGTNTQIACWDDTDLQTHTWTNTTGSSQNVFWIQDGYFQPTQVGTFTLDWTLSPPPACIDPINLITDGSTATSISFSWTAPNPNPPSDGYEYVVSTTNETPTEAGTGEAGTTVTVGDLDANTLYYVFVRSNCGENGYSEWVSTTAFTGYCQVTSTSTAYGISNFTTTQGYTNINNSTGPGSYNDYSATLMVSQSESGSVNFSITSANGTTGMGLWIDWNNDLDFADAGEHIYNSAAYVSNGTGTITVPAGTPNGNYRMRVVANWLSTNPTPCGDLGNATYGEAEDYTFVVSAPPACQAPITVTAVPSGTSVDLTWTESVSPSNGYEYIISTVNELPTENGTDVTGLTVNVADLTVGTTYYAFVRSDCDGDGYSTWTSTSFYIGYCQVTSTSTGYGIGNVTTTNGYTNINNSTGPGSYNDYSATQSVSQSENGVVNFSIASANGTTGMGIWIDWNNDLDFADAGEQVYASAAYVNPGTGTITVPAGTPIGNYRMRVVANWLTATPTPCGNLGNALYGEAEDYTFMVVETPDCLPPTALTATVTSPTTATISWTSDPAPVGGYEYVISATATTPVGSGTPTMETSVDLTDLDFGTVYAYVRANCDGDGFSMWTGPVPITIIEGDICATTINLDEETSPYIGTTVGANNDFSDPCAFNNTSPELFFSVTVPADYTLVIGQTANDYDSENFVAYGDCPGSGGETNQIACWDDTDIQNVTWTNITGADQTVYWIQDGWNNAANAGGFTLEWTLTPPPTCIPPNTIDAENITETTADITWNAPTQVPGNGYEIVISTSNTVPTEAGTPVDITSFDATELTSGTQYYVFVRSNCDDVDFSTWTGPFAFATSLTNDEPCTAVELIVSGECNFEYFINTGATTSDNENIPAPGCAFYQGGDVWFTVTVPANGHVIIDGMTGSLFDCGMAIYSELENGGCDGTLELIACDDDGSDNGNMPFIEAQDLVPGSTLYIRWWEYGNDATGNFGICVTTPCTAPGAPEVTSSGNTATATWTSAGVGAIYNWEVRTSGAAGSGPDGLVQSGTTDADVTTVTITDLDYASIYNFYVSTNCGEGVNSAWSQVVIFSTEVMQGCTDPEACNYNSEAMVDNGSCVFEPITWYQDSDGDGYGNPEVSVTQCGMLEGYILDNTDCDDNDENAWQTGEFHADADGDGYDGGLETICYGETVPDGYSEETLGSDCDDTNGEVWQSNELYIDTDGDGYHGVAETLCYGSETPEGYSTETSGSDCDDEDETVWQSADLFVDNDGDGYDAGTDNLCYGEELPEGYSSESLGSDCDDDDDSVWEVTNLQVTLTLPATIVCDNAAPLNLSGGSPANGTWGGQSVEGGVFDSFGLAAGDYDITYTVQGDGACIVGGTATASIEVDDCSGIDETSANQIKLFPSYTSGNVTVVGIGLTEAVIMDVNGKRLNSVSLFNTSTIEMESLAAGIYFVHVSSSTSSEMFKVVKVN